MQALSKPHFQKLGPDRADWMGVSACKQQDTRVIHVNEIHGGAAIHLTIETQINPQQVVKRIESGAEFPCLGNLTFCVKKSRFPTHTHAHTEPDVHAPINVTDDPLLIPKRNSSSVVV